jgi:FG-GAP-like repeat
MVIWGGTTDGVKGLTSGSLYDPAADVWTTMPPTGGPTRGGTPFGLYFTQLVCLGDRVYVSGGIGAAPTLDLIIHAVSSAFQLSTNSWVNTTGAWSSDDIAFHSVVSTGSCLVTFGGLRKSPLPPPLLTDARASGQGKVSCPARQQWLKALPILPSVQMALGNAPTVSEGNLERNTALRLGAPLPADPIALRLSIEKIPGMPLARMPDQPSPDVKIFRIQSAVGAGGKYNSQIDIPADGEVTFTFPGVTALEIVAEVATNPEREAPLEGFSLVLSSPGGAAVLSVNSATGTIADVVIPNAYDLGGRNTLTLGTGNLGEAQPLVGNHGATPDLAIVYGGGKNHYAQGSTEGETTFEPGTLAAVSSGAGVPPTLFLYRVQADPNPPVKDLEYALFPDTPGYTGGVNIAKGDLNGDGYLDVIVVSRNGREVRVDAFDVFSIYLGRGLGILLENYHPYPSFNGGANVAAGDVNGDGRDEIILAPMAGGWPHVKVLEVASRTLLFDQLVYTDLPTIGDYNKGLNVAAGDWDGDGRDEFIVAPMNTELLISPTPDEARFWIPDGFRVYRIDGTLLAQRLLSTHYTFPSVRINAGDGWVMTHSFGYDSFIQSGVRAIDRKLMHRAGHEFSVPASIFYYKDSGEPAPQAPPRLTPTNDWQPRYVPIPGSIDGGLTILDVPAGYQGRVEFSVDLKNWTFLKNWNGTEDLLRSGPDFRYPATTPQLFNRVRFQLVYPFYAGDDSW